MKRAIGILLLLLALLGAIGVIKNWNQPEPRRQTFGRTAAYDSGRKAGKAFAPILVIALAFGGFYLLKNSGPSAAYPPTLSAEPRLPWHKTKPAKILFISAAAILALFGCLVILSVSTRLLRRSTAPAPRPSSARPDFGPPSLARTGPYELDSQVQARWAGKTIPGRITRINPGGFTVMVQLEDPRFPHPILLSTNELKPR